MGATRALLGSLMMVGLVLAGAGISSADGGHESTLVIDGTTLQATVKVNGTQVGGDPFDVRGSFAATRDDPTGLILDGEGPVTCLDIRGNTAGGTVRVERSSNPALVGTDFYATAVDGGPGGTDRITIISFMGQANGCAPRPELATPSFTSGGLVIADGEQHD